MVVFALHGTALQNLKEWKRLIYALLTFAKNLL
jgi:hypothetical protein